MLASSGSILRRAGGLENASEQQFVIQILAYITDTVSFPAVAK